MKNTYMKAAIGLYSNYFLLGMVNIILSSNMESLTAKWGTTSTIISYIIAAIGFGKLLSYSSLGVLSDKVGRKPLLIISSFLMAIFLVSIPLLPSYKLAFLFAVLAGVANAAMDAGSYPALVEIFTKNRVRPMYSLKPLCPRVQRYYRLSFYFYPITAYFSDIPFSY